MTEYTITQNDRGHQIYYDSRVGGEWKYVDDDSPLSSKKPCIRCGELPVNINGVEDCDYCLQELTKCDFISFACCGHGIDRDGYILLKDGRMFVLERDKDLSEENEQLKDFIRKISTNNEIILANGTIYKIDKVIK